jgi:hypothetical protein
VINQYTLPKPSWNRSKWKPTELDNVALSVPASNVAQRVMVELEN